MVEKLTRRPRFAWLLVGALSLALVAAACDDDDNGLFDDDDNGTPVTTPADPEDDAMAPDDDAAAPDDDPMNGDDTANGTDDTDPANGQDDNLIRGEVVEVDGSGVVGEVTILDIDGQSEIIVTLAGDIEPGTYTHDIREGSCASPGDDALHDLGELEATDEGANGAAEVDASLDELSSGHYWGVYPEGEDEMVGCADLEPANGITTGGNGVDTDDNGLDTDDANGLDDDNGLGEDDENGNGA